MSVNTQPRRADPAPPERRPRAPRLTWSRFDVKAAPYLLISPYFLLFAVFGLFPLVFTLWVSLRDYGLAGGEATYTGLDNYAALLADADFWNAVVNTIGIFALATVPQLVLALLLANALNKRLRGRLLLRLGVLVPLVTSVVAVAVVFTQLYGRDYGLVNWLLDLLGLDRHIDWQSTRWSSWTAIATMVDWRWTGYNAIIYLAAMQTIPRQLYEAAAIDGASGRRQFWSITLPMIRPTVLFTVFVSTIGGLTLFAEPVMFAGNRMDGGTTGQFQTIAMYIVEQGFRNFDYGYAAAAAWLLFVLILLGVGLNYTLARRIGGSR
ncbi:sugar ABC transporter permease [Sphaerisporangium siamense]|uniref:Cellobiose transport system permease protein n=1 Tax=Sphaerisporangium siamense TaxID=795645 RepID=A0A7W7DCK3_9ACTN|nr:sugar ABC transporter permease [Sphaerisporangium siamense]MBB4704338.1 cellobiose transport system permease protein [Sphaerisporangium siamense]GII84981.1 sugar ABC transporter permease [Sphaerisporangium siamense]